jgi:hypothetical protein
MGLYIQGMEMPKDGEHYLWLAIHADGMVEYNENKGLGWQTTTAVPVPPHGRLIDADALVSRCKDEKGGYYGYQSAILGEGVESAPTIIEAEEGET